MLQTKILNEHLSLFHQATGIPLCVFDNTPKDLFHYPIIENMSYTPRTLSHCVNALYSVSENTHMPILYSSDTSFFALLKLDSDTNIILGPVSSEPITYTEFFNSNKSGGDSRNLPHLYRITQQSPHVSLFRFAANISLFINLIWHEHVSVEKLLENQMTSFTNRVVPLHNENHDSIIVTKCLHYIQNHIHSRITVDDLAQYCNMSRRTITRHFTEFHSVPVTEYIIRIKLKEAAFLLIHSNLSLSEISDQLAFSSQSHFSVAFKKHFHNTPKQYRENYKKESLAMN